MNAAVNEQPAAHPAVRGGLVPYLQLDGAIKASEFYQRAFGATEAFRNPPDDSGRTMHVHIYVNGGSLMLSDAYPEYGHALEKPQGYSLMLPLKSDIQTWFDRAVAAGCEVVLPVQKMFWGDLYGQVRDPFGVLWAMNQPEK
jgi:PhnB protein